MQHRNTKDIELLSHQLKIMSVDDICSWLSKFSTHYVIKHDVDAKKLLNIPYDLTNIEYLHISLKDKSPEEINADPELALIRDERDRLSNEVTTNLLGWIQSRRFANVKGDYESALYEAALTLANLNPVNAIDFATQEPISPEKRVVTSDRFQHDIDSLQTWLRHHNKNPWTNLPFSDRDITTITSHLLTKKPNDSIEINSTPQHPGGDPYLPATIALAQSLDQAETAHETVRQHARRFFRIPPTPEFVEQNPTYNQRLRQALALAFYEHEHQPEYVGMPARRLPSFGHAMHPFWPTFFDSPAQNPQVRPRFFERYYEDIDGNHRHDYPHSPIADLPTQQLPEWLSDHAAVKLSNGNFAIVKSSIWGNRNNNEETRQIKIINPASSEIIKTIQDAEPIGQRKLILLENDHVALSRLDINDRENCNIHIYNTDTGRLVKSITKDFLSRKLVTVGDKLITSDGWNPSTISVFDIDASRLSRQVETNMQTNAIFTLGNSLVAIGKYDNHDHTGFRIYDQEFNIVKQFNLNCRRSIDRHSLIGNRVALSGDENIHIINLETESTHCEIAIPQTERDINGAGASNMIRSMTTHDNGNLIISDCLGIINEYSPDGAHLHMVRTNLCEITSPDALKLAYDLLVARHALQDVPVNPETNNIAWVRLF